MINLNLNREPLTLADVSSSDLGSEGSLIVLVPGPETDLTAVTRRVWELAYATGGHVRFLGLCNDAAQEPTLRRTLVTASALMNSGNVAAQAETFVGKDWVGAVKSRVRPSDIVVCWDGQQTDVLRKPMSQLLPAELNVPLLILSSGNRQTNSRSNKTHQIVAWIGFIAIIIGFLLLQIKILQLSDDWMIILEIVSTAIEFWLLWGWNSLLG